METNSATEVSNTSAEDRLAAAFEKAGYGDPVEDDTEEPEVSEADDSEESDSEVDASAEDGEPQPEAEADSEEVEYEGKAYKLPKELKDALLRQQDYTRKTQDVAATRKSLEEKAQSLELRQKFQEEHFVKAVEAQSLNTQLKQYAQVNWAELAESNPTQYLQLDRQYRQLQEAANRVNADIQSLGQQFAQQISQDKQKSQARCIEELKRDWKDFGPELLKELDDTGRSYGFSGEELSDIADPRVIKVLRDAMQFKKLQGSKSLVQKKVQDAKAVKANGSRSAITSTASAKLNEAKAIMKKSGKSSDVEGFLAARFAKAMR